VCGDRPWHELDVVTGCCKFVNFLSRENKAVIKPVMLSDLNCFAEFIFLRHPIHSSKRVMGIEPTCPAWKAGALPLSYTRVAKTEIRSAKSKANPNSNTRKRLAVRAPAHLVADWYFFI
jgi:hypothetical protein